MIHILETLGIIAGIVVFANLAVFGPLLVHHIRAQKRERAQHQELIRLGFGRWSA